MKDEKNNKSSDSQMEVMDVCVYMCEPNVLLMSRFTLDPLIGRQREKKISLARQGGLAHSAGLAAECRANSPFCSF